MSEYRSEAREKIELCLRGLRNLAFVLPNDKDKPFQLGRRAGLGDAIERLEALLDELKEDDERVETRVLNNYFYGDACGAFDA